MSLDLFLIEQVELRIEWDDVISKLEASNIFNCEKYFRDHGKHCKFFKISFKNNLIGAFSVSIVPQFFHYQDSGYSSFFLSKYFVANRSLSVNFKADLLHRVLIFIETHFEFANFVLPPGWHDLRPMLWRNFSLRKNFWNMSPDFTSVIDCKETEGIQKSRYQEEKKFYRNCGKIGFTKSTKIPFKIMEENYFRQGLSRKEANLDMICRGIEKFLSEDKAFILEAKIKNDVIAFVAFGNNHDKAYYLAGSTDQMFRNSGANSALLLSVIKSNKYKLIDLMGVNSPKRAAYKLSFGGKLVPIWKVFLEKGSKK